MKRHSCTGDVDTCPTCNRARDAREFGDDGWSDDDRGLLADGAAANEWAGVDF